MPDDGVLVVTPRPQPPVSPEQERMNRFKFLLLVAVLVGLVGITVVIFPVFSELLSEGNREALQRAIEGMGIWGVVAVFALEVLQVVVAVIPGGAVELVAGTLYGTVGGSLIVLAGAVASATVVYVLVHRLGAPFVQSFVSGKDMRYLRFLEDPRKRNAMTFVLYLIPGLPKDVFTYLIPLTDMSLRDFLVISTIARAPAVIVSAYMGSAIAGGRLLVGAIVFVLLMAVAIAGLLMRERLTEVVDRVRGRLRRR